MEEKEIKARIQAGRNFLRCDMKEDSSYQTDQQLKKTQPPLVKKRMRNAQIDLPVQFDSLDFVKTIPQLFRARKSSRVYTQEPISLLQLSWLLWATQGVKEIRGKAYATLRTVPSGGARHGFETYLLVQQVEGLAPGRYHYLPMEHALEYLGEIAGSAQIISDSLNGQSWGAKASVVFYWSVVPYRCEWRYGIDAHRVILMDVGHVGENLYLACAALGLGTCGVASFNEQCGNQLFELDGEEEYLIYTALVGTISRQNDEQEKSFYRFVQQQGL